MYLLRPLTRWITWTLLAAFMVVVVGKFYHAQTCSHSLCYDTQSQEHELCAAVCDAGAAQHADTSFDWDSHGASFKKQCTLCDFTFFISQSPQVFHYNPFLPLVETQLVERALALVYQPILQLNAHSPPSFI